MDNTSEETPGSDRESRQGRPFGADYRTSKESDYVDRKVHPDKQPKRFADEDTDRAVRPFGTDAPLPERSNRIDYRARPDLISGRLEDFDFTASPDDEQQDAE